MTTYGISQRRLEVLTDILFSIYTRLETHKYVYGPGPQGRFATMATGSERLAGKFKRSLRKIGTSFAGIPVISALSLMKMNGSCPLLELHASCNLEILVADAPKKTETGTSNDWQRVCPRIARLEKSLHKGANNVQARGLPIHSRICVALDEPHFKACLTRILSITSQLDHPCSLTYKACVTTRSGISSLK